MHTTTAQRWFEEIWALREDKIYRDFFGDTGPGIYPIPITTFKSLGFPDPDPRFLTHGVCECPPANGRGYWLYVTSGMSNAWGATPVTANPDDYSGLGYELIVHTRDRFRWPIQLLHWLMAVQLLVAAGKIQGELLQPHDRIPLGGSIGKKDGTITHLLVTSVDEKAFAALENAAGYPARFALPSGMVDLLTLVGISTREADFARTQGVEALLGLLAHHGFLPFTDPERISAL